MVYTRDNSFFICHRCLYTCFLKSDIKRHMQKKNPCNSEYTHLYTKDEINTLSVGKRYYIPDSTSLPMFTKNQLIKLVKNYNKTENVIDDIRNLSGNRSVDDDSLLPAVDMSMILSQEADAESLLLSQGIPSGFPQAIPGIVQGFPQDIPGIAPGFPQDIPGIAPGFPQPIHGMSSGMPFGFPHGLPGLPPGFSSSLSIPTVTPTTSDQKFMCEKCGTKFTKKYNYYVHQRESKRCKEISKVNVCVDNRQSYTTNIANAQYNIYNTIQNNTQNITNSVKNDSKVSVVVKDFINDDYAYDHIPRSVIDHKDFFLPKNFLKHILMNDKNKNIYFENKYAFMYTNGRISRIPTDKAAYLILEKLKIAIELFIRTKGLTKADPERSKKIERYLEVNVWKYMNDTTYKKYNIDTDEYEHIQFLCIRLRDHIMSELSHVLNGERDEIIQLLSTIVPDMDDIDTSYSIHIEDYISTRLRNKPLKDDD